MEKNPQAINITLKLLSLFLLIILVQGCAKESNCGDQTTITNIYNIADSNKSKIPYSGNDTLVFISNEGDTATLIGIGKKAKYITSKKGIGSADCPRELIEKFEKIDFEFNTNNINFNIFNCKIYNFIIYKSTMIDMQPDKIEFSINNEISYVSADLLNSSNFKDSVLIGGKYYKGTYLNGSNNILYNLKYGILKIKFSNGKEYIKLQ
jgi:hypothetical protein